MEDLGQMNPGSLWQGRAVLVTGSSGFLGQWLAKSLSHLGAKVVGIDIKGREELLIGSGFEGPKITELRGEVVDERFLAEMIRKYSIETVFHLAAQSIVEKANEDPLAAFDVNVRGTLAVLEACRKSSSVKQLIQSSSDHVYGECSDRPATEDREFRSLFPYDVSKACSDMIARSYCATYRLNAAITRCSNLYGGGDLNWSRVVPGTIKALLEGRRPVIRSDGKFIRDYLYIEDAVAGYLALAERLAADPSLSGEAFNFSNGEPLKVTDLVNRISQLMGKKSEPIILNEASNEIRCLNISAEKAGRMLGWRARFTLDEGLKRTIMFYEGLMGARPGADSRQV